MCSRTSSSRLLLPGLWSTLWSGRSALWLAVKLNSVEAAVEWRTEQTVSPGWPWAASPPSAGQAGIGPSQAVWLSALMLGCALSVFYFLVLFSSLHIFMLHLVNSVEVPLIVAGCCCDDLISQVWDKIKYFLLLFIFIKHAELLWNQKLSLFLVLFMMWWSINACRNIYDGLWRWMLGERRNPNCTVEGKLINLAIPNWAMVDFLLSVITILNYLSYRWKLPP